MMLRICYVNVSDLAVCQRCPALFGYKVHMQEKDAWREGIKGKGSYYGSMFHKNIARVFFEAAANPYHYLHDRLGRAVSGNRETLEDFIRENIFMPFVESYSEHYTPGQIMAAAEGVRVWVNAMHEFFKEIPSLRRNPLRTMSTIFIAPEQKLQSCCEFRGEGKLVVTGRYDALMFNPDKAEARLFEFKGYSKSDAVVPLSQSVIYAWLIERFSGIVPSVEIIYLDEEDRKPDIFSPASVRNMIASGLPGLFYTAFNTMRLRRLPEIMKDKDFCGECRFRNNCMSDWAGKFRKRIGASLVNVMVFMLAAVMITAHVFFFSNLSSENRVLQAETLQRRFRFDHALNYAIEKISNGIDSNDTSPDSAVVNVTKYEDFIESSNKGGTRLKPHYASGDIYVSIHDLYYTIPSSFNKTNYSGAIDINGPAIMPYRIFSPMIESGDASIRYFLVRVYGTEEAYKQRTKREPMYQALIKKQEGHKAEILTFQEVWY